MHDHTQTSPPIVLTHDNHQRLAELVDAFSSGAHADVVELLELELERAELVGVDELPPDVVTMRSRVVFEDLETGQWREAELVYPHEADAERSKISVLAPVGMALLGLRQGQTIRWPMPGLRSRTLKVVRVIYQPEAEHRVARARSGAPA